MGFVEVCGICAGWGKFLDMPCPQCKGRGGKFNKPDSKQICHLEKIKDTLSEEEQKVYSLYKKGFSQKEMSQQLDMPVSRVILILNHIDRISRGQGL